MKGYKHMNMNKIMDKYADVVIKAGINLYKNQCLLINTQIESYKFALVLAEKAYKNGARFVEINCADPSLTKVRVENSDDKHLTYIPDYMKSKSNEFLAYDWAILSLNYTEHLDDLNEQDPMKIQMLEKARRQIFRRQSEEYVNGIHQWCLISVPGPKWAAKIFNSEPDLKNVEKLWEILIKILKLNDEDPVSSWRKHDIMLKKRSEKLNSFKFDKLTFISDGTQIQFGLTKNSIWKGGAFIKPDNSSFMPNIPTEEIFTTPDFKRTNGKVKITRPVKVMDKIVEGLSLEFKDGKVINYKAEKNEDIIEKYLDVDDGASYVGELALVDGGSEIFKSGLLFNDILYDENAACHIALGFGFPICFSNGNTFKSSADRIKAGCNVSLVHTDFMIGSPKTKIIGTDINGKEIEIMKNGELTI